MTDRKPHKITHVPKGSSRRRENHYSATLIVWMMGALAAVIAVMLIMILTQQAKADPLDGMCAIMVKGGIDIIPCPKDPPYPRHVHRHPIHHAQS